VEDAADQGPEISGSCGSNFGTLYLREGEGFRAVSMHGATPDYLRSRLGQLVHPGPGTGLGRAVRTKQAVHIPNVTAEPAYRDRDPMRVAAADLGGVRTMLNVPMLKSTTYRESQGARCASAIQRGKESRSHRQGAGDRSRQRLSCARRHCDNC